MLLFCHIGEPVSALTLNVGGDIFNEVISTPHS
jgi:hypothetical protein